MTDKVKVESKAIMEKLDGLISAAEEFGNQSEQLSKARGSFDDYLAAAAQAEERMAAVIEKCNEYMDSVQSLLKKDYSDQIDAVVKKTGDAVKACKEQCEQVTADYKEALGLFEQQRPAFEDAQNKMLAATEAGFTKEDELIRQTAAGLEEKTVSLVQELSDTVEQIREELTTTVLETVEQSVSELAKIKQESAAMQKDLEAVKSELEATKAWQIKNEMLIKIGVIAATIAAVASIVNLFL